MSLNYVIDYNQIMTDLPVQNFIKRNFNKRNNLVGDYEYKLPNVKCKIMDWLVRLPIIEGERLYISLSYEYPSVSYWGNVLTADWDINLNEYYTNSDLFELHLTQDLFGMDEKFLEYCRNVYVQVLKEFYDYKSINEFKKTKKT